MSKDWYLDVVEFHKDVTQQAIPNKPQIPDGKTQFLKTKLILEEILETLDAIDNEDLVQVADGIADSIVVLLGTAIAYGIDMRPIWDEVHRTNMAKKGGILRADGKLLKPPGWEEPSIALLLKTQGKERVKK